MKRRSFILGALAAPAVITAPGLLMPVKALPVASAGQTVRSHSILMHHVAIASGNWSDPQIWSNGVVPVRAERVTVPEGIWVTYGKP